MQVQLKLSVDSVCLQICPDVENAGSSAAADGWISSHCISSCLFCIKWKIAKWKVMRKSTCWARSLPFSHIITEIDLSCRCSRSHAVSIERYCIWNACMLSLWNVHCAPHAAAQLGNVLHFIKKISSQPLSGLETRLFINEPLSLFDFSTHWNEWRQAEIPVSSWCVGNAASSVLRCLRDIKL